MREKLIDNIETEKEVLSTMPLKTKKNKSTYLTTLKALEEKFTQTKKEIKEELKKRSLKIRELNKNLVIDDISKEISELETNIPLLNKYLDSFEKLSLDRVIYGLNHFYKDNLVRINKQIFKAIKLFNAAGIELTDAHFDYSQYTYDYMQVFFKEMENDIKSDLLRETFDKIYWQCPDIIIHLDLNIRYLFNENEKKIDEYFVKKQNEYLASKNMTTNDIFNKYFALLKEKNELILSDEYTIMENFINKKYSIADYEEGKIKKCYDKILLDQEYYEQNKEIVNESIKAFKYSLKEYQDLTYFKFVIDDIRAKYEERNSYKNALKNKLKEITKLEDKLRKKNLKIYKLRNSRKPNKQQIETMINETKVDILELKQKYTELDEARFNDKVLNIINNNSSYYNCLSLALGNYNYLTECIRKNKEEVTEEEIKADVYRLNCLIYSPYNKMLNNITILEDKDLASIIVEKYRLLNINVSKEQIEESLEDLMITTDNIVNYLYVVNSKLKLDDIFFVMNAFPVTDSK